MAEPVGRGDDFPGEVAHLRSQILALESKLKDTRTALQDSDERLDESQRIARLGSWELNLETNHAWWSDEHYRLFGRDPATYQPNWVRDMVHPDDAKTLTDAGEHAIATGETATAEIRMKHLDGRYLFVRAHIHRKDTSTLVGTVEDITERRRAEIALRESEARYRQLVDVCPDGVAIHVEGRIRYANPACLEMFGVPDLTAVRNRSVFEFLHPRHQQYARARIAKAHAEGDPIPLIEEEFFKADGTSFWAESTGCSIEFEDAPAILLIMRDITARKTLEVKLRQSDKLESLGTLAFGIAHDFNNILQAISGFCELAQERSTDHDQLAECLRQIQIGGRRAADLVNQILTFSRKSDVEVEPTTLQPLVEEALKFLRSSIPPTIQIRSELDNDCGMIVANATQIHEVVTNLCTNAMHAMDARRGVIGVAIQPLTLDDALETLSGPIKPGDYVQLVVTDTGTGIDPDLFHRLLDPFFTTKEVGVGTGLGLATVHGIAKSMGGGIGIESKLGTGTTVRVIFPVLQGEAPPARAEAPSDPALTGHGHILVVDDEIFITELETLLLQSRGFTVEAFNDTDRAMEAVRTGNHDLAILDYAMPGKTGIELAREFHAADPTLPVIVATGLLELSENDLTIPANVVEIIKKPFRVDALVSTMNRVLASAES